MKGNTDKGIMYGSIDSKLSRGGWDRLAKFLVIRSAMMKDIVAATRRSINIAGPDGDHSTNAAAVYALHEASLRDDRGGYNPTFYTVCKAEFNAQIRDALRKLNAIDAECVRRRFGIDCEAKEESEIAKEFGVSRTMIWHRLQRAMKKLTQELEPLKDYE